MPGSGTKEQTQRFLLLRLAVILAVFLPLFFAVSALGSRLGFWGWRFGFGTLVRGIGPKLIGLTVITALAALAVAGYRRLPRHIAIAALCLAVPLTALIKGKQFADTAKRVPPIHDISTDTVSPPQFGKAIIDARNRQSENGSVNSLDYAAKTDPRSKKPLREVQAKAYPEIVPLNSNRDADELYGAALKAAKKMGWTIVAADEKARSIEATATTFWFGFTDDVVIRIAPSNRGARLDIRSVSRVGVSDVGANAARIRKFMEHMRS